MGYLNPFPRGTRVSQPFGSNPSNGVNPTGGHTGKDWAVPIGTPVRAAGDGVIRHSDWFAGQYNENPWWLTNMGGDTLVLDCGDAEPTFVYAHLLDSTAPVGAHVLKGQIIGFSGNSGTATTGPHCHNECLPPHWDYNNGTYGRVNPDIYLTEWWDEDSTEPPGSLAPMGDITTPVQEDELSAADVAAIRGDLNTVHEAVLSGDAAVRADVATVHNTIIRDVGGQLGALREVVDQLAAGQGVTIDYSKVEAAAQAGAEAALKNGIKITVEGA